MFDNRFRGGILVAVCSVLVLAAGSATAVTPAPVEGKKVVRLGLPTPLTGSYAFVGKHCQSAAKIGVKEINDLGLDFKLELFIADNAGSPEVVVTAARKLVERDNVDTIGAAGVSHGVIALHPMLIEKDMAYLDVCAAADANAAESKGHVFMFKASNTQQYTEFAKVVVERLKGKKVALGYAMTDAGLGGRDLMREFLGRTDVTIVKDFGIPAKGLADYRPIVMRLKQEPPVDAVINLFPSTQYAMLALAMREAGFKAQMLDCTWWNVEDYIAAGEVMDGAIVMAEYWVDSPDPKSQAFVRAYRAETGKDPDHFAALTYDAVYCIAEIAKKGARDRSSILRALKELDYYGITGRIRFDEKGFRRELGMLPLRYNDQKKGFEPLLPK